MLVFPTLMLEHELIFCLRRAEGVHKTLPDIPDRHRRRMNEVVGIESIVPQLIEHDFIGREIADS